MDIAPRVELGVPEPLRADVAALYDQAFGAKLAVALPDTSTRLRVLAATLRADRAFVARHEGQLLGVAGFHASGSGFTDGLRLWGMLRLMGVLRGVRAAALLSLLHRRPRPGELLMDGIAVAPEARGAGLGTRLLEAVCTHAKGMGLSRVRLDVVDSNPRAKALYERLGFEAKPARRTRWGRFMGFAAVTEMVRPI